MKYFFLVSLFFAQWLHGQNVFRGDFADPSIIKVKNNYYAVGTSSEWAPHFPIYTSTDLQNWKQVGYVFDKAPEWTSGSFWAPEYFYHNNTYFIYYTARRKKDNVSYIGVATSKYPDKGFKDHGVLISFGKEAIDAFVYNENGQLYITFKAYGLDKRPIEILGSKLSKDGLKLEGEVFSLLKDSNRKGMEGQSFIKQGGYYYLFYSAGGCCGADCSYNVRVARSKNFKGPYEDYQQNPILSENDQWKCMGHGTFLKQDDGKYVYMHHAYNKQSNVWTGREAMLSELVWNQNNGWPSFVSKQNAPDTTSTITDAFTNAQPALYWQWDFRHSSPVVRQENNRLHLSGTMVESNHSGIVLAVRPLSDRFDIMTTVENSNGALKGLAFYGDVNEAMGVGVVNDTVIYWMNTGKTRIVLAAQKINPNKPTRLKFSKNADLTCNAYFSQDPNGWTQLLPKVPPVIGALPQWDRSPRAGLHFMGLPTEQAVFSNFEFKAHNSHDN